MSLARKPQNACELVRRVLQHPGGGLQALLKIVEGGENEWLELKAASFPEGGVFAEGANEDDYRWNVAKAAIALANSVGGVVLLGVNDAGQPIGIEASDPKGKRGSKGAEAFRREVVWQQVLLPMRGWKTGRSGTIKLTRPRLFERLLSLEEIHCDGKTVLAIFVAPSDYGFVEVTKVADQRPTADLIYVRKRGAIGQVIDLPKDDLVLLDLHEQQRKQAVAEIGLTWERFLASGAIARPVEELVPAIQSYIAHIEDDFSSLEDVYVPLDVEQIKTGAQVIKRRPGKNPLHAESWLNEKGAVASPNGGDDMMAVEDEARRGLATELVGQERRALLIGEGGAGKSGCFAKLALDEARLWAPDRSWPLLVRLSEYSDVGLAGQFESVSGIKWQDLAPLVAEGRVTLYLDGLNECPDALYESCCVDLASLLGEYPDARVRVGSRSSAVPENLGLATFEMQPLDHEQQLKVLRELLGDDHRSEDTLDRLYRQPGAAKIFSSPLLLRIAAEIVREGSEIPRGRAALYRRFVETWYRREAGSADRGSAGLPCSLGQMVDALTELAFRMRQGGLSTLTIDRVQKLLSPILGEEADSFIDWTAQGTILARSEATGAIRFWHETIQEYFCAEFLAERHEDLDINTLTAGAVSRQGTWAMPLAFALELVRDPSPSFLDMAWQVEPLIVAAAAADVCDLGAARLGMDAWSRGVLRTLCGDDASEDARAITMEARLPPKYPLPAYLVSTLRSSTFWYAAQAHEAGKARLVRLQKLVCGRQFPWIELLPEALTENKEWGADLSPALRFICGVSPRPSLNEVLETATVSELCALRRQKRISADIFLSQLERSLARSTEAKRELDLVDILRSEKDKADAVVGNLLKKYRPDLRRIAGEQDLSLRLLNVLVRNRVVEPFEIRNDPERLRNILSSMSMMNALRLAKVGVIQAADLDADTRDRLIFEKKTTKNQIKDALRTGLICDYDLPRELLSMVASGTRSNGNGQATRCPGFKFYAADLTDKKIRTDVDAQLKAKGYWRVSIKRTHSSGQFGFVSHSDFDRDIYCHFSKIASNGLPLAKGVALDVRLATRFDQNRGEWGVSVVSGRTAE